MKVKLIRENLINSVFRKNSNKINETKVKKQINILKVIGYSEYVSNFIKYKDIKKDSSGNSFLEILEKYFLENVLDEEQKKEYEKLCKLKNIKGDEENHNNLTENNLQSQSEDIKDENKKMGIENNNELIDLREILYFLIYIIFHILFFVLRPIYFPKNIFLEFPKSYFQKNLF